MELKNKIVKLIPKVAICYLLIAMVIAVVIFFANRPVSGTVLHLKAALGGSFLLLPIIIFILYKFENHG